MTPLEREILCAVALSRTHGLSQAAALQLYRAAGSATALFEHRADLRALLPDVAPRAAAALRAADDALHRAEAELEWAGSKGVDVLCLGDDRYPVRLRECPDAPLVLYYKGTPCLSARRMVAVVGTRRVTEQGKELCRRFCDELAAAAPGTVVVSGLAYGVDIHAHRAALAAGLPTVGVLAHGLDRLYPPSHRREAAAMLADGGLLTEYMTGTVPDKGNFVRRNRIVAGLVDACVVVESAARGGALITARLAADYHRDVFAFPGRVTDPCSEGCNQLIASQQALLLTGGRALAENMGWAEAGTAPAPVQRELFPELTEAEAALCELLRDSDGLPLNMLVVRSGRPVQEVSALLFELEMKGVVKAMAGSLYRLL